MDNPKLINQTIGFIPKNPKDNLSLQSIIAGLTHIKYSGIPKKASIFMNSPNTPTATVCWTDCKAVAMIAFEKMLALLQL